MKVEDSEINQSVIPDEVQLPIILSIGDKDEVEIDQNKLSRVAEAILFSRNHLINPNGKFMERWDSCMVIFLLFTSIVTPFEVAFVSTDLSHPLFWINQIVNVFFIADLFLVFFVPIQDDKNRWLLQHKKIALAYLRFWFWINLISSVPYDLIGATQANDGAQNANALRLLRLLRLIKLLRLFRTSKIIQRWSPRIPIRYSVTALLKFMGGMLMLAHWFACLLGFLPFFETDTVNWQTAYFETSLSLAPGSYSIWTIYLGGFYLAAMTLTTIGYGDVVPKTDLERGIYLIMMFLGAGAYAYAIGNIFNIVSQMDPVTADFHDTMDELNDFMHRTALPKELRKRVRKYYHFALHHKQVMARQDMFQSLPPSLQRITAYAANAKWVDQLPFLVNMMIDEERSLVLALSTAFTNRALAPRERVISKGQRLTSLFAIERGAVLLHVSNEMYDKGATQEVKISPHLYIQSELDRHVQQELTTGYCFGHEMVYALAGPVASTYNASTLTYAELHVLDREDFMRIIKSFPAAYKRLTLYAIRRGFYTMKFDSEDSQARPSSQSGTVDLHKLKASMHTMEQELSKLQMEISQKSLLVRNLLSGQ